MTNLEKMAAQKSMRMDGVLNFTGGAPVTQEQLDKMTDKCFHSGREIQVGDHIFWGLLYEKRGEELITILIKIHEDEYDKLYEYPKEFRGDEKNEKMDWLLYLQLK
jgi:hypothetical protein